MTTGTVRQVIRPLDLQQEILRGGSWKVVDVRQPEEWDICRIEGALLIPMTEISQRAPTELDKDERIVLYCHHGVRSERAQAFLQSLGFKDIWNLEGGIERWAEELDPKMARY